MKKEIDRANASGRECKRRLRWRAQSTPEASLASTSNQGEGEMVKLTIKLFGWIVDVEVRAPKG